MDYRRDVALGGLRGSRQSSTRAVSGMDLTSWTAVHEASLLPSPAKVSRSCDIANQTLTHLRRSQLLRLHRQL